MSEDNIAFPLPAGITFENPLKFYTTVVREYTEDKPHLLRVFRNSYTFSVSLDYLEVVEVRINYKINWKILGITKYEKRSYDSGKKYIKVYFHDGHRMRLREI